MARPTALSVSTDAFVHNINLVRKLAPACPVIAVVKANGYGHDAVWCASVLEALPSPPDALAVCSIQEAEALRKSGHRLPIILLEGVFEPEEYQVAAKSNFWPIIHSLHQLDWLVNSQVALPNLWLKFDTGMHRLGLVEEEFSTAQALIKRLPSKTQANTFLLMHFACADEPEHALNAEQLEGFEQIKTTFEHVGVSTANSARVFSKNALKGEWVRPGIMLYGSNPMGWQSDRVDEFRSVMRFTTEVIALREVKVGETVGYGATWEAQTPSLVATLAVGYADGYPRHAPNGTPVWIKGKKCSLVGRVSMDMIAVDVTELPDIKVGDMAELWGANLSVDEVASWVGTIGYELLTKITQRVPRKIV